jgi:hypothetical protein
MGLYHSPRIITEGLVLCLDAANIKSYPGSGTAWTDLSGNGNNGTLVNGPTFSAANSGSIDFDGTNDYVAGNLPPLISDYTIELWFKLDSLRSGESNTLLSLTSSNNHGFLGEIQSNRTIRFLHRYPYSSSAGGDNFFSISLINLGQICCISWVRDSDQKIYINGSLDNQITATISAFDSNLNQLTIGQLVQTSNARNINGSVYNLKIYNRSLSVEEVTQNFNALRGRFGI